MKRLGLLLLALAFAAEGKEVARDEHGGVLDVSGFYKNFLSAYLSPGGAVDANLARVSARFRFEDKIEVEAAYQLTYLLASSPIFNTGASLSGTVGGTGTTGPQRRLLPLSDVIFQTPTQRLEHDLDRLSVRFALPFGDLTIGRQVLSWGTGRFWNPTDVLSPFPPTVIDREIRRGFDAVRLAIALGDTTQLDLLYLPQPVLEDNGAVARFQTNFGGWDVSASAGKYLREFMVGADVVGDLGPVGVHAEGAYTVSQFFRGVAGADFKPAESLVLTAEYSYNGFGSTNAADYTAILTSPRALRGEVFGAGKHVAAIAASWRANDLLSAQLSLLMNLTDPSALALASAEYSFAQSVLMRAGVYVPMGSRLSEYGRGVYGGFVQVGLYVP